MDFCKSTELRSYFADLCRDFKEPCGGFADLHRGYTPVHRFCRLLRKVYTSQQVAKLLLQPPQN